MTKELFIKYLQGRCTEQEFDQLISWIKEGALSASGKSFVKEVWQAFEPESASEEKIKYNRLLDKIHHQININDNQKKKIIERVPPRNRIFSIISRAAAILLIPVLSFLIYTKLFEKDQYNENTGSIEVMAPASSRMHIDLGDGTSVWLNHGSTLKYPYRFEGKERRVFLTGEAYFEVAHNSEVPFIVGTNQVEVKAIGTAFNVSAYTDDYLVETTLVEGKVILYDINSSREIKALSPNECLKYNAAAHTYRLETRNTEKYTAWKDGVLIFKNDSITEIAKKLSRWYNVEVEITSEKVKEYTYTATFTDETLYQVLELMTLPTPVSYKLTPVKKLSDGSYSKQKVLIGMKNSSNN